MFTDNKRLDEWVSAERLDTRKVQYPRKDGQTSTGLSTPKKVDLSFARCDSLSPHCRVVFTMGIELASD